MNNSQLQSPQLGLSIPRRRAEIVERLRIKYDVVYNGDLSNLQPLIPYGEATNRTESQVRACTRVACRPQGWPHMYST